MPGAPVCAGDLSCYGLKPLSMRRKIITMALKGKRVLFISYNGMLDPLGQSQVLPYLRQLAEKGVRFTLLSFEREVAFSAEGRSRCEQLQTELAAEKINWHRLRYHQKPSLPATSYDVMRGISYAQRLVRDDGIELLHARSHIPATISLALKKRFALKMIFDVRGLMAEEYVDAGHWRRGGVPYRLTKAVERRALAASDAVVTLSERIWPIIKEWEGLRGRSTIHKVVPCCVDLELFRFRPDDRARRRSELGLGDRFTIVYSGSIDGWYQTEEMADFFHVALQAQPSAHLLWLTTGRHERLKSVMSQRGIQSGRYTIKSVDPQEVPSYLSASDAGICFVKPCFSKLASSPTKNAEYLACGLPLIINEGIGDSEALIARERVGALVSNFSDAEYSRALAIVEEFVRNPGQTRRRTREVAERLFDLRAVGAERYSRLYEEVLA